MVKTIKKDNSEAKLDLLQNSWEGMDNLWDNVMGEEKQSRPSYYAILPANVRYDPQLTHLDKLLYAEISVLSNKLGYCYASNQWFADLYNNSDRTIRKSISHLAEHGHIFTVVEGVNRRIYMNFGSLGGQKSTSSRIKTSALGGQKLPHNNTSIIIQDNNTSISEVSKSKPEESGIDELPDSLGKNYISRLVEIYHLAWNYKFKFQCLEQAKGRTAKILKNLKEDYTEYEIASMIFLHFEWKGLNNDNEFMNKKLEDNCFPMSWLAMSVNSYQTFLKEKMGIKDSKQLKIHVDKAIAVCRGAV